MTRIIIAVACLWIGMIVPGLVEPAVCASVKPSPGTGVFPDGDRASAKGPLAVFPEMRHIFEPVMEGEKLRHDFLVENRGEAPLVINGIRPD
jgi:hypothetical protein